MGHQRKQTGSSNLVFLSASAQRSNGPARGPSRCPLPQTFRQALLRADFSYSYRRRSSVADLPFRDVFKVALSHGNLGVVQLRFHGLRRSAGRVVWSRSGRHEMRKATARGCWNDAEGRVRLSVPAANEGCTGKINIPQYLAGSRIARFAAETHVAEARNR
jgi:hypothetical protein